MLPSIIQENFLTKEELDHITNILYARVTPWDDYTNNKLFGSYHVWSYYSKEFKDLYDVVNPKFLNLFGHLNLIIDHSHIFQNFEPYPVHSDFYQKKELPKYLEPAYTFIIPLEDYNSNTLTFDQYSETKEFDTSLYPELNSISDDFYEEYLSHVSQEQVKHLSVKEIFPWKQGSLHACDRRYYHCSDNYLKRNVKEKRAIIMWSSIKK